MINALIQLDENTNRVLNVIKAKYALKDKSEAITVLVNTYIENSGEPELRPEFVAKIKRIQKQKSIRVDDFAKHFGLKEK